MSNQSFTTSSAVAQADNTVTTEPGARSDLPTARDFLLLCKNNNIAEAVHALYYLPQNYKLMVMHADNSATTQDNSWMNMLQNRITFENKETSERGSPYSFADAIISDEQDTEATKTSEAPYVFVSASAANGVVANGVNGFTVQSGNPEALASAILYISRK